MGNRIIKTALVLSLLPLAACRGDSAERQSLIDAGVKSCVEAFQTSGAAAGTGADPQRICNCAVGKMAEGKSVEEIRQFSRQETPSEADVQAIGSCIVDELQRSGNASAAANEG